MILGKDEVVVCWSVTSYLLQSDGFVKCFITVSRIQYFGYGVGKFKKKNFLEVLVTPSGSLLCLVSNTFPARGSKRGSGFRVVNIPRLNQYVFEFVSL